MKTTLLQLERYPIPRLGRRTEDGGQCLLRCGTGETAQLCTQLCISLLLGGRLIIFLRGASRRGTVPLAEIVQVTFCDLHREATACLRQVPINSPDATRALCAGEDYQCRGENLKHARHQLGLFGFGSEPFPLGHLKMAPPSNQQRDEDAVEGAEATPRRLFVFCDGTWQDGVNSGCAPTNIATLARCLKPVADDGYLQISYYDSGLGNGTSKPAQLIDGATGRGTSRSLHAVQAASNCARG